MNTAQTDNTKLKNQEVQFILTGLKDSLIVLLAAGACLASMYTFIYF
ncbi:hypothetical protein ACFSJU_16120 [Paradesertivirga mongoliensis]|uniref:Uncharacterized protein n=1 Tax=Paradesertivirga mongoliensis TaxID=2100740 RepID=A0ABW4ZQR5_9SPHI|nr:hypothetical protein [Pedobacter mongoliensis]